MTQAIAHRPLAEDVPDDALLKIDGATLSFGQVRALKGVTMHARRGEVTAIVGDNGAGKSTLIRCVSGVHVPDAGSIAFDGQAVHFRSPHDARDAGIETVHQNLALVEDLTVWQNLFLNREIVRRFGPFAFLNRRAMRAKAEEMVSRSRGQRARGRIAGPAPVRRPAASRIHLPRSRFHVQADHHG